MMNHRRDITKTVGDGVLLLADADGPAGRMFDGGIVEAVEGPWSAQAVSAVVIVADASLDAQIAELSLATFEAHLDAALERPWCRLRAAISHLREGAGGRIVMLVAETGTKASPVFAEALSMMARSAALECRDPAKPIAINLLRVLPGVDDDELHAVLPQLLGREFDFVSGAVLTMGQLGQGGAR